MNRITGQKSARAMKMEEFRLPNNFAQLLRSCQFSREIGEIDAGTAFTHIANLSEGIVWSERLDHDAELQRILAAYRAAEAAHGLEPDESFAPGEAPAVVKVLDAAFERRAKQLQADVLRQYGEFDIADLLLSNEAEFLRRHEAGRRKAYGGRPL